MTDIGTVLAWSIKPFVSQGIKRYRLNVWSDHGQTSLVGYSEFEAHENLDFLAGVGKFASSKHGQKLEIK